MKMLLVGLSATETDKSDRPIPQNRKRIITRTKTPARHAARSHILSTRLDPIGQRHRPACTTQFAPARHQRAVSKRLPSDRNTALFDTRIISRTRHWDAGCGARRRTRRWHQNVIRKRQLLATPCVIASGDTPFSMARLRISGDGSTPCAESPDDAPSCRATPPVPRRCPECS